MPIPVVVVLHVAVLLFTYSLLNGGTRAVRRLLRVYKLGQRSWPSWATRDWALLVVFSLFSSLAALFLINSGYTGSARICVIGAAIGGIINGSVKLPFVMGTERHHDQQLHFSIGIPRWWTPQVMDAAFRRNGGVFAIENPDGFAMLNVSCRPAQSDGSPWKERMLGTFRELRERYADPGPLQVGEIELGGRSEVVRAEFTARHPGGGPSNRVGRILAVHNGFGYILHYSLTSDSNADIDALLASWQFTDMEPAQVCGLEAPTMRPNPTAPADQKAPLSGR